MATSNSDRFTIPKLTGRNYAEWATDAKFILKEKGLGKFIESSNPPMPGPMTAEAQDVYDLKKDRAHAILFLSVSTELKSMVKNCPDAFVMWEKLRQTYEPVSMTRMVQLRRKFLNTSLQNGEDMAVFICRVDEAVQDCRNAGVDIRGWEHAFQYMEMLPASYDIVTNALHRLPFDTLTPLMVSEPLIAEFHRLENRNGNGDANKSANNGNGALFTDNASTKTIIKCYNCGKNGHFARNCRSAKVNDTNANSNSHPTTDNKKKKSKNKAKKKPAAGNVAASQDAKGNQDGGGMILYSSALSTSQASSNVTSEWIVDSGATDHICSSEKYFISLNPCSKTLELGEGHSAVTGFGDVRLKYQCQGREREVLLTNVLLAPNFHRNLISTAKIDAKGFSTLTKGGKLFVYRDDPAAPLMVATKDVNLWKMQATVVTMAPVEVKGKVTELVALTNEQGPTKCSELELWHRRFCHLNIRGLALMKDKEFVVGLKNSNLKGDCQCEICSLSKINAASTVKNVDITSTSPLDLLHADLWGPARTASHGGARYILVIIDDFSRMAYIAPIKTKDQTFAEFTKFVTAMETRLERKVKQLRTDNGSEFCSKEFEDFLEKKGIHHQKTNVYSPAMNGVAERFNRTLLDGTRALLADSGLPTQFWAELACGFVHVRNRFSCSKIGGRTPISLFFGKDPSVHHLRILGSKCIVLNTPPKRANKLNPKGWSGILVGYAKSTLGYRVWNPEDNLVYETKNVRVFETHNVCPPVVINDGGAPKPILPPQPKTPAPVSETISWDFDVPELSTGRPAEPIYAHDETRVDPVRPPMEQVDVNGETRVDPVRPAMEPQAVAWTKEISRPRGKNRECSVRYSNDAGETLYQESALRRYHQERGLHYDPTKFDFETTSTSTEDNETEITFPGLRRRDDLPTTRGSLRNNDHAVLFSAVDPVNYKQAMQSPEKIEWTAAMDEEIATLKQRDVFEALERPENAKVLGTKWVYKTKNDSTGDSRRHRARLVVQGFRQTQGLDYDEVFSPVVNFVVIRLFCILLVVRRGWVDAHLDVKCAYLYGELPVTTFISIPEGYHSTERPGFVWRLKRALYGLHQSGRQWYQKLVEELMKIGFSKIPGFSCAFHLCETAVLLFYVDDLILFALNGSILSRVIHKISSIFDVVNLGPIHKLLGVSFERNGKDIAIHQKHFILSLADEYGIVENKMVKVPMHVGTVVQKPSHISETASKFPYRSLIGSLLFLATRTRPDIMFAVILLSQYNNCFDVTHEKCLIQVLQYVVNTYDKCISLSKCASDQLHAYTDASWANSRDDCKSFGGYIVFLGGAPISWGCKKQRVVALSSMEAEFMAIVNCLREVHWLAGIFRYFSPLMSSKYLPIIFSDSMSAIHFCKNELETTRTKHINIKYNFVKDWLMREYFVLRSVSGKVNLADIFTKPQSSANQERFLDAVYC